MPRPVADLFAVPRGPLPLINASVTTSTHHIYRTAVHRFLDWVLSHSSLDVLSSSPSSFDWLLSQYLHHLWRSGNGKQGGKNTVYGCLLFLPRLRGRLHYSLASLRGWERLAPSSPHQPMSYTVLVLVSVGMSARGWFSSAVGAILAFECYLRVSELVGLRRSDVALPDDRRLGVAGRPDSIALRLRKTKRGVNQWVTVRSPLARALLLELMLADPEEDRLFPFSAGTFRRRLHAVCAGLGLAGYVPHSLRHGGATHDHLSGLPLEDIMLRGRWASVKSARHYVQQGRALLLARDLDPDLARLSDRLRVDLYDWVMHFSVVVPSAARQKNRW